MQRFTIAALAALSTFILATAPLAAHDGDHDHAHDHVAAGELCITGAWARAMLPGQSTGAGYLNINNQGEIDDRLLSVTSPVAGRVEIHSMEVVDDVMVMRPLEDALEIATGEAIVLEPGGLHLMFMDVATPFTEGDDVPATLQFEVAGSVELSLPVHPARTGRGHHEHQH